MFIVVYGIFFVFWFFIKLIGGFKKMGRNYVYFSIGFFDDDEGVIFGMRKDVELLIYIDVLKVMKEGNLKFWMSENGVVFIEGEDEEGVVSLKYFKEVVGWDGVLVGVIWRDGEFMDGGDLFLGLKIR